MMKTHSISLFSWGMILASLLLFGQVGAQVHAELPGPEADPTDTQRVSLSGPASPDGVNDDWSWYDGIPQYSYVQDFLGNWIHGVGTYVGYWQNASIGQPSVNSVYYLHVVVYGMGIPAAGYMNTYISFQLPPNSTLAMNSSNPLYCFGGEPSNLTRFTDGCPQSLPVGIWPGTYAILSGDASIGNTWPTPAGWAWEFQIPAVTSTALNNSSFVGAFHIVDGYGSPWLYPTVPIYVFSAAVTAPGPFGHASPINGATGLSTSPTLSWGTSSGASSYWYCYDTTDDDACSSWVDNGTATSKTLGGLAANTTYYWLVRSVNSGGTTYSNGSSTGFWSFTTADTATAPEAFDKSSPANAATDLSTGPTLLWGASNGADSYWYCYDASDDNDCSSWVDNGTATSRTLSGLADDTTYYWHVRAVNGVGTTYSNASNTAFWSFKTRAATSAPGAFGKISPASGDTGLSTSPTLLWAASSGADSYWYCYDTSDDDACSSWVDNGTATSKTLSGLADDTTYNWHVRAVNSAGTTYSNGSNTAFWSFRTAAPGEVMRIFLPMTLR